MHLAIVPDAWVTAPVRFGVQIPVLPVTTAQSGAGAQWAKRSYWYAPEPGVIVKSTFTLLKVSDMTTRGGTAAAALVPGDYVAMHIEAAGAKLAP